MSAVLFHFSVLADIVAKFEDLKKLEFSEKYTCKQVLQLVLK